MKKALIAVNPLEIKGPRFERFCEKIRFLQDKGFISRTSVAAVAHRSQHVMPFEYYKKHKDELAQEARAEIQDACQGQFKYSSVRVLQSNSHSNEDLVAHLSRHGKRLGLDILIIGSNDRKGLPYWLLGSFAETASLLVTMPVLILKNSFPIAKFARTPRLVLAVDVSALPSTRDLTWIANFAKSTKSHLSLIYIEPQKRIITDSLQERKNKKEALSALKRLAAVLQIKGALVTATYVVTETRSVAHDIVDFAESEKAWMTIATTPPRKGLRKLLLGSNARHILALSKRPFLSLRLE